MTFQIILSDTGGFMTITFLITVIIVERLQTTIYYSTLIKKMYKYQDDGEGDDGDKAEKKGT
jgi:hypothetical protein